MLPEDTTNAQEDGNCCKIGLALATGSTFVAVGCLVRTGATTALVLGLLGALASLLAYGMARHRLRQAAQNRPADEAPVPEAGGGASGGNGALAAVDPHIAQLKDSFLSTISHELRTPLTNICAYTEILLHLVPGDEAEWPEFLRIVQTESQRLTRLVDSVMDYVRLESGEVEFARQPVDLRELARRALDVCSARARSRDIELELVAADDVPAVVSDGGRLTQVLVHLLDNALKFSPGGGRVQVHVGAGEDGPGGERFAEVSVDDSGPGIDPELRERAFEKFAQLRDPMNGKLEGTGLGLATVRLLLSRLGGRISCEESPLGGARFRFSIPARGAAVDRVPAPPAATRDEAVSAG